MPRRQAPKKTPRASAPEGSYGFADVVKLTTATRSELIHWTNTKIITPAIVDTAGPGYPRRFSLENLVEVELCAAVNRFKVRTTLIADAAESFRHFHRRNIALTDNGPTDGSERFTPGQQSAYLAVLTQEFRHSWKKQGLRWPKDGLASQLKKHLFNETVQRVALKAAAGWEQYRRNREFRNAHFCGTFVVPPRIADDDYDRDPAALAQDVRVFETWSHPLDLNWALSTDSIVINLIGVLNRIEQATGGQL